MFFSLKKFENIFNNILYFNYFWYSKWSSIILTVQVDCKGTNIHFKFLST